MIAIIDYDAGNLGSVKKAFDHLETPYRVVNSAKDLETYEPSGIVLPGVGAFGPAAETLKAWGFFPVLKKYIDQDRPFLGICLGMQMLMEYSEEAPGVQGLGIIPGTCRKFRHRKVPQIGWNRIHSNPASKLFKDVPDGSFFYFIHSYYVEETSPGFTAASTCYHNSFTSAFEQGNLCAVQFHPEKSGETGLQLLRCWVDLTTTDTGKTGDKTDTTDTTDRQFTKSSRYFSYKKSVEREPGISTRIIPCLDVDNGRVVKGVNFKNLRDAGDPVELASRYNNEGADEITFLDIGATYKSREILLEVVEKVSRQVFVPMCVGGGISSVKDMRKVLNAGADKVSMCSAAIRSPVLLTEGAKRFGSQCIVLSIDAGKAGNNWHAFVNGGREDSGIDALEWAKQGERLGAGEILLNSIDCDGTQKGYDLELTRKVTESVNIPVIASGGAGKREHMVEAVREGKADAVLLASLLHDKRFKVTDIKSFLNRKGVNVRW
jgi:cyclase